MKDYNWQAHYEDSLCLVGENEYHRTFQIKNETGSGEVNEWDLFPGLKIVFNELQMERCAKSVPLCTDVVEISYCADGSYECALEDDRYFIIGPGDLSVGVVGRSESRGGFPVSRYVGFTIFVEIPVLEYSEKQVLTDLGIDLQSIRKLTGMKEQRFILHTDAAAFQIAQLLRYESDREQMLPMLRLKTLELMNYLSDPATAERGLMPVFISGEQARIASAVQKRITEDLSDHIRIGRLAEELNVSPTAMKTAFRKVYGTSIYAYLKDLRLREARRLLLETNLKVTDIAVEVGYSNPGKFSVSFKEKYGIQPRRVRALYREGRTIPSQKRDG